jgi:hypothetical protein
MTSNARTPAHEITCQLPEFARELRLGAPMAAASAAQQIATGPTAALQRKADNDRLPAARRSEPARRSLVAARRRRAVASSSGDHDRPDAPERGAAPSKNMERRRRLRRDQCSRGGAEEGPANVFARRRACYTSTPIAATQPTSLDQVATRPGWQRQAERGPTTSQSLTAAGDVRMNPWTSEERPLPNDSQWC